MPVFMDDPSVLTKERLKSELLANNVELPGGNPPRDVYVQLYVKTLRRGTDTALDAFSSDEELPPPALSRRSRSSGRKSEVTRLEQLDVALLTDDALREQLLAHGVHAGPIVASTRKLYENKLQKLQDKGAVSSQKNHNGSRDEVYSDEEDELTAAPDPKPKPTQEPAPEQKEDVRNHTSQRRRQHSTVSVPEVLGPSSTEKRSHSRGPPPPSSQHASAPVAPASSTRPDRAPVPSSSPAPALGSVAPGSSSRHAQAPAATGSSVSSTAALAPVLSSSRSALAMLPSSFSGSVSCGSSTRPAPAPAPAALDSSRHAQTERVEKVLAEPPPEEEPAVAEEEPAVAEEEPAVAEEEPAVPELTGLTATCRRPIKGAAGRPVTLASHSHSAHAQIRSSSHALSSVGSTPSTASTANPARLSGHSPSSATPFHLDARQAKVRGSMSWWKKLLLWVVLAAFLFLVYQAMETNRASPFEETQEL